MFKSFEIDCIGLRDVKLYILPMCSYPPPERRWSTCEYVRKNSTDENIQMDENPEFALLYFSWVSEFKEPEEKWIGMRDLRHTSFTVLVSERIFLMNLYCMGTLVSVSSGYTLSALTPVEQKGSLTKFDSCADSDRYVNAPYKRMKGIIILLMD